MARFTKMPVTIEAMQFVGHSDPEAGPSEATFEDDTPEGTPMPDWLREALDKGDVRQPGAIWWEDGHPSSSDPFGQRPMLFVGTINGPVMVVPGDWVVRGVKGELYPCAGEIFAETYMPAELDGYLKPAGTFRDDLASTINRWSIENDSDTPDFMLADYVITSLQALAQAIDTREQWYGRPAVNPLDRREPPNASPLDPHPWVAPDDRGTLDLIDVPGSVLPPETTEDLLYDLGNLLRGYEEHHRAKAENNLHADDRLAKAETNAKMAQRVERKLYDLMAQAEKPTIASVIPPSGITLQRAPDAEGGAVTVSFSDPEQSWGLFNLIRDVMGPATGSAS